MIDHTRECTGRWQLQGVYGDGWVLCEECGARHRATHENLVAAVDQNYLDARIRELAAEGANLLAGERKTG